jgi:PTH1 family peptidyl-tRNA hydrolase
VVRLVVGLGNPGRGYERTRHNIGFRLADHLAGEADLFGSGGPWKSFEGLGLACRRGDVWLAKPMTYMNESGRFVRSFIQFHKIPQAEVLVCFDDVALPLGVLRLRPGGSAGGQKGMASILSELGTPGLPRLRLGIGPQPERMDSADFVLKPFSKEEEGRLPEVLGRAAQAVAVARDEGLEAAMNRFNRDPEAA